MGFFFDQVSEGLYRRVLALMRVHQVNHVSFASPQKKPNGRLGY